MGLQGKKDQAAGAKGHEKDLAFSAAKEPEVKVLLKEVMEMVMVAPNADEPLVRACSWAKLMTHAVLTITP